MTDGTTLSSDGKLWLIGQGTDGAFLNTVDATGEVDSGPTGVGSGNAETASSGNTVLYSGNSTGGNSGTVKIYTGDAHFNSGDIVLSTGTSGGNKGHVIVMDLPSNDPHVVGALWNSSGVLRVSAG